MKNPVQKIVFDNIEQVKTFNFCLSNMTNALSNEETIELQKVVVFLCRNFDKALKDKPIISKYDLSMQDYVYALVRLDIFHGELI